MPRSEQYILFSGMRMFLLILAILTSTRPTHAQKPIALGTSVEIPSTVLTEMRSLNIYLPPGYSENDTMRYQVIYLLDGGIDEDFIHTVGLVQFNTMPWVHAIPQSIIVGIANTDRKRDMTSPTAITADKDKFPTTGGSAKFMAFLEKELKPYIEQHYRTSGQDMLIGQSLAGLLATEILLKHPDWFDNYLIISPSLWWNDGSLLKLPVPVIKQNTGVYIAVGKEGLAPGAGAHVMEVDANLLAEQLNAPGYKMLRLHFDYLPGKNHATIGHQALMNGFEMLFNEK